MKEEITEKLRESYNKHAAMREKSELQPWKLKVREDFMRILKEQGAVSVLDIGAGTGKDSRFFSDNGFKAAAADFSHEMVKLCRDKGIETFELDFLSLHKINRKFDAVWSQNSLLHTDEKDFPLVLEEVKKILSPGGLFFLGVYGGEDFHGIWEEDFYAPHRFFSFYTDDKIRDIVGKYFTVIDFKAIETGGRYHFQSFILKNE